MHNSEDFEIVALEIFQVFDDVIDNLESVDAALNALHKASKSTRFSTPLLKVRNYLK